MDQLPLPDFVLSDFERLLSIPKNKARKEIMVGKLRGHRNGLGQWRVSYEAAVEYVARTR